MIKMASECTSIFESDIVVNPCKNWRMAPRDKYGRALAYVFREPDDTFINGRLVEQGFARVKARASETAALQPLPCSPALAPPTGAVNRGPDLRPQTYKPNTRYEGLLTSLQSEAKAQRHG